MTLQHPSAGNLPTGNRAQRRAMGIVGDKMHKGFLIGGPHWGTYQEWPDLMVITNTVTEIPDPNGVTGSDGEVMKVPIVLEHLYMAYRFADGTCAWVYRDDSGMDIDQVVLRMARFVAWWCLVTGGGHVIRPGKV